MHALCSSPAMQTSILREYLALEMKNDNLPFPFDPERILDDFVFMCFFVGKEQAQSLRA